MKVIKHKDKWYLQSETGYKEILLSTDAKLIEDGVQAIDDTFLEWFVKNPSCEEVEVQKWFDGLDFLEYKIIIPQEEPKQETLKLKCEKCGCDYEKPSVFKEYLVATKHNVFYKWSLSFCDKCRREKEIESLKALPDILRALEEPKQEYVKCTCDNSLEYSNCGKKCERILDEQETLEEAAEKYAERKSSSSVFQEAHKKDFIEGANYQAERMYSEEEVIAIVEKSRETGLTAEYLLLTEQFKKK